MCRKTTIISESVGEENPPFKAPILSDRSRRDGFAAKAMSTRAVEKLIGRYVAALDLDPHVTVHSLRVTALTTARERGSDIIDLQDVDFRLALPGGMDRRLPDRPPALAAGPPARTD